MANPVAPQDANSVVIGFGIALDGANDIPTWIRLLNPSVVADETTKSGSVGVGGVIAHDAANAATVGPVKAGGRAQAPLSDPDEVADDDIVDALFDRNGRLAVYGGQIPITVAINTASSGDTTLVSADANKRIAVWHWDIVVEGAVDVRFEDGAGGTALTGQYAFTAAGEGLSASAGGLIPLWVGSDNTLLNLELSGAVQVMGSVTYTKWED